MRQEDKGRYLSTHTEVTMSSLDQHTNQRIGAKSLGNLSHVRSPGKPRAYGKSHHQNEKLAHQRFCKQVAFGHKRLRPCSRRRTCQPAQSESYGYAQAYQPDETAAYLARPPARGTEDTTGDLIDDAKLQHCIEQCQRPIGVEVVGLCPQSQHQIQNNGSDDVERDKCRKEGEVLSPASIPKNEEQPEILYEAGRPEQEIETC